MNRTKYETLIELSRKVYSVRENYCQHCDIDCQWKGRDLSFEYTLKRHRTRIVRLLTDSGIIYACGEIWPSTQEELVAIKKELTGSVGNVHQ